MQKSTLMRECFSVFGDKTWMDTGCRGRIRTGGLEVMSLAGFQTALLCRMPLPGHPFCQQARKAYASSRTMERRAGLEPARPAWKAGMLPTTSAAHVRPEGRTIEKREDKTGYDCICGISPIPLYQFYMIGPRAFYQFYGKFNFFDTARTKQLFHRYAVASLICRRMAAPYSV